MNLLVLQRFQFSFNDDGDEDAGPCVLLWVRGSNKGTIIITMVERTLYF